MVKCHPVNSHIGIYLHNLTGHIYNPLNAQVPEQYRVIHGAILGIFTVLDDDRRKTSGIERSKASGMMTIDSASIAMTIAMMGNSGCGAADGCGVADGG